jgi:hypothetical protein
LKLIYVLDVVVISILLFSIISTALISKQYLDGARDKGIIEKLYGLLLTHNTTFLHDTYTLFSDIYLREGVYL